MVGQTGGLGQQGVMNPYDATKIYLANSEGNKTTTDLMKCPGQDLGEKVLNYVKLLVSGQLGGGDGIKPMGGYTGPGSIASSMMQGGNLGGLGQAQMFPQGTNVQGFGQNMGNNIGNFLGQ